MLRHADLRALRQRDDSARRRDLHLLLHLVADARLLAVDAGDGMAMDEHDALLNLSDTLLAQVRGEFAEVPYRAFGLVLRAVLLAAGTRAAAEEDDGGDFSDVIHVGMWEYECLYTMMFLLACKADLSTLPPITPSLHAVHVATLYQGVVSVVTGVAQVLCRWVPTAACCLSLSCL